MWWEDRLYLLLFNFVLFIYDWLELLVSILDVFEFFIWIFGIWCLLVIVLLIDSVFWIFVYLKKCWRWYLLKFDIYGNKVFVFFYCSLCIFRFCLIRFWIFGVYIRIRYYIYKFIYSIWILNLIGICIFDKYYINYKKIFDIGIFGLIYILYYYLILWYI